MGARTPGPFHYYDEVYSGHGSITGDTIRATADEPARHATTISALAHELHGDERTTASHIDGQIKTAVAQAPKVAAVKATALGANGTYAVGLIHQFATYVDTFDDTVDKLNAEYQRQLSVLRAAQRANPPVSSVGGIKLYPYRASFESPRVSVHDSIAGSVPDAGPSHLPTCSPPTFGPYIGAPPSEGACVTPQNEGLGGPPESSGAIKASLQPSYQAALAVLDEDAEHIAMMFKQGATPDNVHDLILAGEIPLSAATLFPGLRFSTADLRTALGFDPTFAHMPQVTDPGFRSWYAALSPFQKQLAVMAMQSGFPPKDFDPLSTVKPGEMPPWAQQTQCPSGDAPYYGYFGGGSIAGPGGAQWPIVMPYLQHGDHIYMADDGQLRPDGGIEQMDGRDPGWSTVATYEGLNNFGHISAGTKVATALVIGTGGELETTETDPGAVRVGPDGHPYAGNDVHEIPQGPPDKAYWDMESKTMMPEGSGPYAGAASLITQSAQAGQAVANEDSHAHRQWYVDYQVNNDGRTRAIVHTYTAGPTEEGKTYVGSFANSFPTGNGHTSEIPYNTRYNEYSHPTLSPAPDPNVDYSGRGEPLDNADPINEPLNR